MSPPLLIFTRNLLTSKILWTQVVALLATILTASGVHILDDPATQTQWIGYLDMAATVLLRWAFDTGPVSVSAPLSTPTSVPVPVGTNVVHVAADVPETTYAVATVAAATVTPTTPGNVVPPAPKPVAA